MRGIFQQARDFIPDAVAPTPLLPYKLPRDAAVTVRLLGIGACDAGLSIGENPAARGKGSWPLTILQEQPRGAWCPAFGGLALR